MSKTGSPLPQRILVSPEQLQGDRLTLLPDQRHYLTRVLRLSDGAPFVAMFQEPVCPDGQDCPGGWWLATLDGEGAVIRTAVEEPDNAVPVTLIVAIAKGGGFDEVLRQGTELGVATLVPVTTERTVVVPGANKIKRWRRIVAEAAEQCERSPLPRLLDPMPWSEALKVSGASEADRVTRCICVARQAGGDGRSLLQVLQGQVSQGPSQATQHHWIIAIGPEGGWTGAEKAMAIAQGFHPVSLGDRILRAVTAAVTAMAIAAAVWESH